MKHLKTFGLLFSIGSLLTFCSGQQTEQRNKTSVGEVGGPFENGEYIYNGLPGDMNATDTSAGWKLDGQKILITGIVYQRDGKTPEPGVLLYYYQTNTAGRYIHKPEEPRSMAPNELGQTHGYIRGWVKTDGAGKYFIYTVKPGTYPTRDAPAHIHFTVKEPNDIKEYYIDDVVFDDDPLLNTETRRKLENRCGSGIVLLVQHGDLQIGERNVMLGLNIPNYPK